MAANTQNFLGTCTCTWVIMNIFVLCFLVNCVNNALQSPGSWLYNLFPYYWFPGRIFPWKTRHLLLYDHITSCIRCIVSNHLEDSNQKSLQNKINVSSNINTNLYKPSESILLNLLMKTNHSYTEPFEIHSRLVLLDYILSFIFNDFLKWHIEVDQNYSENSDEDEQIVFTSNEEFKKTELQNNKSKDELVENKYYIKTTQNGYKLNKLNILQKRQTKHTLVYLKINREEEINLENPIDFYSSSLLSEIKKFQGNKSRKPSREVVLNEDEGYIKYSGKESQNTLVADNIDFESLEGTQEVDISKRDSDGISSNSNIYNKPKNGEEKDYFIKTQSNSSSIKVQQLKYKNSFKFHPNLYKLILTNSHHSPSIVLRNLMPRTIVKRSSPSAITRQLEMPTEENFPVSIAGSSLYGTYAYAHTRPSEFGLFPPFGGEEGEEGQPIEGGEGGEDV